MNDLVNAIQSNLEETAPIKTNVDLLGLPSLIITLHNNHTSTVGARKLVQSIENTNSYFTPFIFPATTPHNLNKHLAQFGKTIHDWTWPKSPAESISHLKTGMILHGYGANDYTKVVACLVSHMRAWSISTAFNVPIAVFEHDAILTKQFTRDDYKRMCESDAQYGVVGLNDPRGATRKSNVYLEKVLDQSTSETLKVPAPWIDDRTVPQGIAGNSAYIITPAAAKKLFSIIDDVGLWPNDALMCKQLMGQMLYQSYPFYTGLQGISSTTQG
jgi:GR25 family glycosyltransferase involved in LPS biosynthesis